MTKGELTKIKKLLSKMGYAPGDDFFKDEVLDNVTYEDVLMALKEATKMMLKMSLEEAEKRLDIIEKYSKTEASENVLVSFVNFIKNVFNK